MRIDFDLTDIRWCVGALVAVKLKLAASTEQLKIKTMQYETTKRQLKSSSSSVTALQKELDEAQADEQAAMEREHMLRDKVRLGANAHRASISAQDTLQMSSARENEALQTELDQSKTTTAALESQVVVASAPDWHAPQASGLVPYWPTFNNNSRPHLDTCTCAGRWSGTNR